MFFSRLNEISGGCEKGLLNDSETGNIFSQPPLISFKRDKKKDQNIYKITMKNHLLHVQIKSNTLLSCTITILNVQS